MSNPHPVVFIRQLTTPDIEANSVAVFKTLAAAKYVPWFARRMELGLTQWKGDQWRCDLWDDDLGLVLRVERKTVRTV